MNYKNFGLAETSENGLLTFVKEFDWTLELEDSMDIETEEFNEEKQEMIIEKTHFYVVYNNDKVLFSFNFVSDDILTEYEVKEMVRKEISQNYSEYLGDFYLNYLIENLIYSIDLDEKSLSDELALIGATDIDEIEGGEDREDDESSSVSWNSSFTFTFKNKKYSLYVSGTAIAEISYERWCTTYGYNIDDWDLDFSK